MTASSFAKLSSKLAVKQAAIERRSAALASGESLPVNRKAAKRGPAKLSLDDKRNHCVSVRLNPGELAELDAEREAAGEKYQRGEWLRMSWTGVQIKGAVPAINHEVHIELSRTASNLNQLSKHLNERGISVPAELSPESLIALLSEVRMSLIGAVVK